jgi:hypothetical protein
MPGLQFTFTGPVTINQIDTQPIMDQLAVLAHNQGVIVTALEDLQAADADLAAVVTSLVADIDRLDTDFIALEAAVAAGDPAAIAAEAAKVRDAVNALTAAKANIDATDVPPAV